MNTSLSPLVCLRRRATTRTSCSRTRTVRHLTGFSDHEVQSARTHCLSILRKHDTPSFLLRNYIPARARDAYIAIRTFNVDVARTADATTTPAIGTLRLQFHRDAISSALAGKPLQQPIAILLASAAEDLQTRTQGRVRFSRTWFQRLVSTREKYLTNPPYPDLAALESYAENTYSTLMYLTLQALPLASVNMDHVASHIGKAAGIAAVLRGLPLVAFPPVARNHDRFSGRMSQSTQGAVMLPLDIMVEHGVREEDVMRQGSEAPNLRDAVFAVATRANDHLLTTREMLKSLRAGHDGGHDLEHGDEEEHMHASRLSEPEDGTNASHHYELERAFGVFMSSVSTSLWLDRLQKHNFDVFAPELRKTDWRLPFTAWWAYTRRKL